VIVEKEEPAIGEEPMRFTGSAVHTWRKTEGRMREAIVRISSTAQIQEREREEKQAVGTIQGEMPIEGWREDRKMEIEGILALRRSFDKLNYMISRRIRTL